MNEGDHCLITFPTTHHALAAERALHGEEVRFVIVPTPRALSAGCGLAIKLPCAETQRARAILSRSAIQAEGLYRLGEGGKIEVVEG